MDGMLLSYFLSLLTRYSPGGFWFPAVMKKDNREYPQLLLRLCCKLDWDATLTCCFKSSYQSHCTIKRKKDIKAVPPFPTSFSPLATKWNMHCQHTSRKPCAKWHHATLSIRRLPWSPGYSAVRSAIEISTEAKVWWFSSIRPHLFHASGCSGSPPNEFAHSLSSSWSSRWSLSFHWLDDAYIS